MHNPVKSSRDYIKGTYVMMLYIRGILKDNLWLTHIIILKLKCEKANENS